MKICVVGGLGNMGRRYCAILKYLGHNFIIHDVGRFEEGIEKCDGIIIATPTVSHYRDMLFYKTYGIPLLVEKPITKTMEELIELMNITTPWAMVNQYEYFDIRQEPNLKIIDFYSKKYLTHYDFFKTGSDGLTWDCINLVGLAKGTITLSNTSPIWTCVLNGNKLEYFEIDYSYLWMISNWCSKFYDNREYAFKAHEKVFAINKEVSRSDKM